MYRQFILFLYFAFLLRQIPQTPLSRSAPNADRSGEVREVKRDTSLYNSSRTRSQLAERACILCGVSIANATEFLCFLPRCRPQRPYCGRNRVQIETQKRRSQSVIPHTESMHALPAAAVRPHTRKKAIFIPTPNARYAIALFPLPNPATPIVTDRCRK